MRLIGHGLALAFIFLVTCTAWMVLGGVTSQRSTEQQFALRGEVSSLWGESLQVSPPTLTFRWATQEAHTEVTKDATGVDVQKRVTETVWHDAARPPASARVQVDMTQDVRRKGLVWFPLYGVDFDGTWTYTHDRDEPGWLSITWPFPSRDAFYDGFALTLDGVEQKDIFGASAPDGGQPNGVSAQIAVTPGQTVEIGLRWKSRGSTSFSFTPAANVGEVRDFKLDLTTDFTDIDFPEGTLSPTTRTPSGSGVKLGWAFDRVLTGKGIGMIVPCPVQPGVLASSMAFSAPISLGLFMVWLVVLGLLKGIEVHPVNHAFLAAAFFGFHLLFGYTADRLPVEAAFALSSVVSVFLVVTYLVRVVSPRFAVIEAGLAQVVYLVGFALAHFWDGATGLTLTVIGLCTLFALMQLTSKVRWAEVFARGTQARAET